MVMIRYNLYCFFLYSYTVSLCARFFFFFIDSLYVQGFSFFLNYFPIDSLYAQVVRMFTVVNLFLRRW